MNTPYQPPCTTTLPHHDLYIWGLFGNLMSPDMGNSKVAAMASPPPSDLKLQDFLSLTIDSSINADKARDGDAPVAKKKKKGKALSWEAVYLPAILGRYLGAEKARRLVHGMKVGIALVAVSLLYILDVVHDRLGDNAMWAVMTVVVLFELTSGATIAKGVNRGIGTIAGGGLGFLTALLAQGVGGKGKAAVIAIFLFISGMAATYTRMIPTIKKRYDYGTMIFILTFSLVAVSGIREDQIIKVATDRLSSISMGFAICIFTSLFVFPIWAGDELHRSLVSKFNNLAPLVEVNVNEYFRPIEEKADKRKPYNFKGCLSVLYSKTSDESLANFAKWEPWHGKFGFQYPWNKYLEIGELLRDLAISILSVKGCLESESQAFSEKIMVRENFEAAGKLIGCTIRELGQTVEEMTKCQAQDILIPRLQQMGQSLSSLMLISEFASIKQDGISRDENLIVCFIFVLVGIIGKLEGLARKVEELGVVAEFRCL